MENGERKNGGEARRGASSLVFSLADFRAAVSHLTERLEAIAPRMNDNWAWDVCDIRWAGFVHAQSTVREPQLY